MNKKDRIFAGRYPDRSKGREKDREKYEEDRGCMANIKRDVSLSTKTQRMKGGRKYLAVFFVATLQI